MADLVEINISVVDKGNNLERAVTKTQALQSKLKRLAKEIDNGAVSDSKRSQTLIALGRELKKVSDYTGTQAYGQVKKYFNAQVKSIEADKKAAQYKKRLARVQDYLTERTKRSAATLDKAASSTKRMSGAQSQAAIAARNLANQQRMAGKSTNKFGMYTQQVGYQVGDFFVQVQSGTDALVAFGQQGTQLAGLLPGLAGAILGIGLAVSTALGRAYLESENLTINFKEIKKDVAAALEPIKPIIDSITSAFAYLGDVARNVGSFIADNFARLISYAITFAGIMVTKVVAGFILSGKAARAFFTLVRMGLMLSGIGLLVIGLGEVVYRFSTLVAATGSFGSAMGKLGNIVGGLWDFAVSKIDVYLAQIQTVGPAVKAFLLGILNSVLTTIEEGLQNAVGAINRTFNTSLEVPPIGGGIEDSMVKAQIQLGEAERKVKDLKSAADGSWESLMGMVKELIGLTSTSTKALDTTDWLMNKLDEDTKKANDSLSKQNEELKKLDDQANRLAAPFENFFMALVDGTTSAKDAFRVMATDIIQQLYRILVVEQLVQSIAGLIKPILAGPQQGPTRSGQPLGYFDGGGYTGNAPRSGGLDGKGGFMAMLHPRETVVDHTKGQSSGGDSIVVHQNFNFSANGDDSVKKLIAQAAPQIQKMTESSIMDSRRRGGKMKAAFG